MLIRRIRMRAVDLLPRIAFARESARRALAVLVLFVAWLFATWLGPELVPPGGWRLGWVVGALALYTLLTCVSLPAMFVEALGIVRSSELRRVISQHAAPFWTVGSLAGVTGAAVFRYGPGSTLGSACLGIGAGSAVLVAILAWARIVESSRLERDRRHLAIADPHGPVTLF